MQTFLPYADFAQSAAVLDWKRLGKQRVETLQIMKALTTGGGLHGGWSKHPASRMWMGNLGYLMMYQDAICREWTEVLGFRDTCRDKTHDLLGTSAEGLYQYMLLLAGSKVYGEVPWFIGDEEFHLGHQSNLIRKAPEIYRPIFGDDVPDDLEYKWVADV